MLTKPEPPAENRKPRLGAIICGRPLPNGMICQGVCKAYSSPSLVTYCRCESCKRTKKVPRNN